MIKSLLEKEVDKVKTLSLFHLWLFIAAKCVKKSKSPSFLNIKCIHAQVRVSRGNQLAGLEGANNDSVFIGKVQNPFLDTSCRISPGFNHVSFLTQEGRPFEFSHLKARVDFCEGSSQVKLIIFDPNL